MGESQRLTFFSFSLLWRSAHNPSLKDNHSQHDICKDIFMNQLVEITVGKLASDCGTIIVQYDLNTEFDRTPRYHGDLFVTSPDFPATSFNFFLI